MPDINLIEKDIEAIIGAGGTDKDVENYLTSSKVTYKINKEDTKQPEKKVGGVLGIGSIPESAYNRGERNIMGEIFERPGAAIRSTIQGKGYMAGAINPANAQSFQDIMVNKFTPKTSNVATNFAGSILPSTIGMGADMVTNPANLLMALAPKIPIGGGKNLGQAVAQTEPAKMFSQWLNKERKVSDITKHLPQKMGDNWLVNKAKEVKTVVDDTINSMRTQYQKIFAPHKDLAIPQEQLKAIPKTIMEDLGIADKKSVSLGELWEARDSLLQQINEGSWSKGELYKRLKVKEEDLLNATQKIKAAILNKMPKEAREAILDIDPKYTETMKLGKKIIRTVYEPTSDTYKTGSLINVYKNPSNAGARDAFRRFEKYNKLIGQAEKDMKKYTFRQGAKKIAGALAGSGALLYAGHRYLTDKLLNKE